LTVDLFRFLGLAFAASDLLFEVDADGAIAFAAGAGNALAGKSDASLIGRPWRYLFDGDDHPLAEALITGLDDGERRGPAEVRLAAETDETVRYAALSVFRLPQNAPRLSCVMTMLNRGVGDRPTGGALHAREEFEAIARGLMEATRHGGPMLELGLVEFAGLSEQKQNLSPEEAARLDRRIAGAIRAEAHGDAATDLGDQRFALLRKAGEAPHLFARRLNRILGAALEPHASMVAVDGAAGPNRLMRALRFALDNFVSNGLEPTTASSLSDVLKHSMQRTVEEAGAFGALIAAERFKLVFQPVVSLTDGAVHHHEALVRFDGDRSPFAMIRMAEELDIIQDLDRAMTEAVAKRLRKDRTGALRLAVNVSGRTIVSGGYVEAVSRLTRGGDLAGRLIFEVTETAAIDDLRLAQRHVHALQTMGFQVCLDDFGSGAASFAYLQQLRVDVVKIDGSYVRELTSSGRDDAMIRHLVHLCRELKVATVAEMVETQAVADMLARSGVDFAQGWLYGQPTAEPATSIRGAGPPASRRRGAVEQWG
jgi:EAL domain-containing protein (putative c-di-GMP-specific phosphodiesterase class I)